MAFAALRLSWLPFKNPSRGLTPQTFSNIKTYRLLNEIHDQTSNSPSHDFFHPSILNLHHSPLLALIPNGSDTRSKARWDNPHCRYWHATYYRPAGLLLFNLCYSTILPYLRYIRIEVPVFEYYADSGLLFLFYPH